MQNVSIIKLLILAFVKAFLRNYYVTMFTEVKSNWVHVQFVKLSDL